MATPYDFARGSAMMGSFANAQQNNLNQMRQTSDRWSNNWGTGSSQNSLAPAQQGTNFPNRDSRFGQGMGGPLSAQSAPGGSPASGGAWDSYQFGPGMRNPPFGSRSVPRDRVGYSYGYRGPLGGGNYGGGISGGGQYGGYGQPQTGFSNPYSRPGTGQQPPQFSPYSSGSGVNRPDIAGFMAGNDLNTSQNALPWYTAAENQAQNQIANNQWDQTFNWQQQGDRFNMGETARMNDFSQWMGGEQMRLAYGDQALNEWSLGNQHQAAMAGIDLGYYSADTNYNLGMQQSQNQYDLGMANVGLGYSQANQQYGLGMRNADINEMNYQNQYNLGMTNADISRQQVTGQLGLGQGQLDWQRYNTDTQAGLTREQMANDLFLGKGNLALQQELGRGALGVQQGDLALRGELGRGELALSGELGRGNLALQRQLGLGQLGVSQGELALSKELGRGDLGLRTSQQSLDEAYRRQALQQQADLERESLQNQLTQSRYAAFGRAQAPNIRMNRSW